METLLTVSEAAKKLQVHPATIRRSIADGLGSGAIRCRLKASRFGKTYRIRPDDLDDFIRLSSKF